MTVRDAIDDADAVAMGADAREARVAARQAAFQQLARLRLESSYRLARVILNDPAEAEDATHDAFVQAWQRWPSLRDPRRLEAWFDRILLNTCRNRLRSRRRRAVARSNGPSTVDSASHSARSRSSHRSWLHATAARRSRWRGGNAGPGRDSRSNPSRSRASSSPAESDRV